MDPVGGNGKDKELGIAQWIVGPEPVLAEFGYCPTLGRTRCRISLTSSPPSTSWDG